MLEMSRFSIPIPSPSSALSQDVLKWFAATLGHRLPAAEVVREYREFRAAMLAAQRWTDTLRDALELVATHRPATAAEVLREVIPYQDALVVIANDTMPLQISPVP